MPRTLILFQDSDPSSKIPNVSDQDLSDGLEFNSDGAGYDSEDNESHDDFQYLRTQARSHSTILPSSLSPSKSRDSSRNPTSNLEMNESDSDDLLSQQMPPS